MQPDRIVINDPELGKRLLAVAGGGLYVPEIHQNIARVQDGKLLGGTIYTDYTQTSIAVHMAGLVPHWINRDLLWVGFDYPFTQLGVRKLIGLTPASNERALTVLYGLGFEDEYRLKDAYPDGDLIITSMYRENCRWLRPMPRGFRERVDHG